MRVAVLMVFRPPDTRVHCTGRATGDGPENGRNGRSMSSAAPPRVLTRGRRRAVLTVVRSGWYRRRMALRSIVLYPDPVLLSPTARVETIDDEVRSLVR